MAAASFWFLHIENIFAIFGDVYQAARWPIGIYPQWLRFILTFIVPVAIAVTVPAEAAVGRLTCRTGGAGAGRWPLFTLVVSRVLWRLGLKRYSGASA